MLSRTPRQTSSWTLRIQAFARLRRNRRNRNRCSASGMPAPKDSGSLKISCTIYMTLISILRRRKSPCASGLDARGKARGRQASSPWSPTCARTLARNLSSALVLVSSRLELLACGSRRQLVPWSRQPRADPHALPPLPLNQNATRHSHARTLCRSISGCSILHLSRVRLLHLPKGGGEVEV